VKIVGKVKQTGEKRKLIAARGQSAPRWADIKKHGLKRARTRRIRVPVKHWRDGRIKV